MLGVDLEEAISVLKDLTFLWVMADAHAGDHHLGRSRALGGSRPRVSEKPKWALGPRLAGEGHQSWGRGQT